MELQEAWRGPVAVWLELKWVWWRVLEVVMMEPTGAVEGLQGP
jgi:hypothetical protein